LKTLLSPSSVLKAGVELLAGRLRTLPLPLLPLLPLLEKKLEKGANLLFALGERW
jgi:hypothetical protein